jgi:hypothetical protein
MVVEAKVLKERTVSALQLADQEWVDFNALQRDRA